MRTFKLLSGYIEPTPLDDDGASWMWSETIFGVSLDERWELVVETSQGIGNFLRLFPDRYIIPIKSITGNGICHTFGNRNNGNGWGFDITSEFITIEYYVYNYEQ
jgi:hypothetical protein